MAARWIDHILGPDTTANRPAAADAPVGALYQNADTGDLEINAGSAWDVYRTAATGGLSDPTTTKGDLLVRGSSSVGRHAVGSNKEVLTADSAQSDGVSWTALPVEVMVAVSDESTAITTGTAKVTFRMPFAMTLTEVRASLNTASSSGTPTIDINEAGSTILSTKLTIDASEKTSTTATTAAVISDANLADDAEMTVDIDTAGTGAKGLKITLIGTRA